MSIIITEGTMQVTHDTTHEALLNDLLTTIATIHQEAIQRLTASTEQPEEVISKALFDDLNQRLGNLLDMIAPESYQAYEDFTATALAHVEDIYLQDLLEALPEGDLKERQRKVQQYLQDLRESKLATIRAQEGAPHA